MAINVNAIKTAIKYFIALKSVLGDDAFKELMRLLKESAGLLDEIADIIPGTYDDAVVAWLQEKLGIEDDDEEELEIEVEIEDEE